jgi:hypothetical protein
MTKDAANQFIFCGSAAVTSAAPEELTDSKKRKQYGNSSDDLFDRNAPFGSVQDK